MPKRYWWVILTYIITQLSGIIFLPILFPIFPGHRAEVFIYYTIVSFVVGLLVTLYLLRPDMKKVETRAKTTTGSLVIWAVLGVFMAYFAQGIAAIIETQVFGIETGSENTQDIMNITRTIPLFAIIPAIIAPILEEVIFRKIIFGTLYMHMNFFLAALLSAFAFGIIHGEPEHLLIYASMGFVFAFLYVKTKTIIVPIIVHMALNSISVIVQFSLTPEDIERMQQQLDQVQMVLIGGF
ncbi:CPBP family intramembrane glutamic endopeptidase [Ornithinibacillus contaminans]|uniref:CPBP family intramembrane glutamic endopeptidase n=1 Tax=Ornithinibacillus contaminans TaxID=694055 RepID=UPI00064DB23D|nr:type II CAAX endopeptidase family protein [Ornithinibacillus contaminans]